MNFNFSIETVDSIGSIQYWIANEKSNLSVPIDPPVSREIPSPTFKDTEVAPQSDMIFVKSFTLADFPKFKNLPGKVRNLRHLRPEILIF